MEMKELSEVDFKTATIRKEGEYWYVTGRMTPPKWSEPYVGRIRIPSNLSSFYVVAELARLFGEHSVNYFNYLPPKLREMLRTSTESVIHTLSRDENNQQVELRIVEKPEYSLRASLMFTDYETRKRRTSIPLSDLNLYTFKEFIKPDIKRAVLVDRNGEFIVFTKNDDGSITFENPFGERLTLNPEQRCVIATSLLTLLGEQVRYWEFINNVRREAVETALDDLSGKKEELILYLKERAKEDKKCRKLLSAMGEEDWLDRLKDLGTTQPRLVEPLLEFAVKEGISERAEKLLLALTTGRAVWRKRVKAIRPLKLIIPDYEFSDREPAVSFWNDYGKEIPQPRMRFGRYYIKESVQNPIPILVLLSVFEPD